MPRTRFIDTVSQEEIDSTMKKKTTSLDDRGLKIYRAVMAERRKSGGGKKKKAANSSSPAKIVKMEKTMEEEEYNEEEENSSDSLRSPRARMSRWPSWIKFPAKIDANEYIGRGVSINVEHPHPKIDRFNSYAIVRYDEEKDEFFLYCPLNQKTYPTTLKVVYMAINFGFILNEEFTNNDKYGGWVGG